MYGPRSRADVTGVQTSALPIGYRTFTEAACNGTAVLYTRRDDRPEQDCLIEWLNENARCGEVSETALMSGRLAEALADLWQQPLPPLPKPTGIAEVENLLVRFYCFGHRIPPLWGQTSQSEAL